MNIDELIAKYLNGESTVEETNKIKTWRSLSAENEMIFKQSEAAWILAKNHPANVFINKEKTWAGIQKRIGRRHYTLPVLLRAAGVAASIALIMSGALTYIITNRLQHKTIAQPQKITMYVPAGVCSKTILPDSTIVWLNASSMMSYPSYFEGDTRSIELFGEAFFDVARDEAKPFIIHSGNLKIKVLGTSFNFKHYKEDVNAVIAVETGAVTLSTGTSTITTLHAGKFATVDTYTLQTKVFNTPPVNVSKKNNDVSSTKPEMIDNDSFADQFSSWRKYKMIFRDEPFNNVLNGLSRRYNVEFEIQGDEIKQYVYTATFDDMSLEDILNLLKMSSPIDYSINSLKYNTSNAYEKRKVIIFKK